MDFMYSVINSSVVGTETAGAAFVLSFHFKAWSRVCGDSDFTSLGASAWGGFGGFCRMIVGVKVITNSVSAAGAFFNRKASPIIGISPRKGTFVTVCPSLCLIKPANTTDCPSSKNNCVCALLVVNAVFPLGVVIFVSTSLTFTCIFTSTLLFLIVGVMVKPIP